MKLAYAFLAVNADQLSDGRLCIFGGDFDNIQVQSIPAVATMALVVRFAVFPDESLEGHTARIDVHGPDGTKKDGRQTQLSAVRNSFDESEPSGINLIANLVINLNHQGKYQVCVNGDGTELGRVPFWVTGPTESGLQL